MPSDPGAIERSRVPAANVQPPVGGRGARRGDDADRRGAAWVIDRAAQVFIFLGGVSAIVFILAIFIFITREGVGFLFERFDPVEFFTSPRWMPTSARRPTYGALALIVGTASVTGLAMLVAVPLSLGAAVYIAEFAWSPPCCSASGAASARPWRC
jgi:ABC-type phosphate transport system permease subunit